MTALPVGTFYEFFAGGGMARAGIGKGWQCLFANDFDPKKAQSYTANWDGSALKVGDINGVAVEDLPGEADLVWASFPCQDLSLAGGGAGLKGERSGTFWPFWERIVDLTAMGRKPHFIVLENVVGMLTSHRGKDFGAICDALAAGRYRYGAVVVDAAHFVPQSRKRVFIVAVSEDRWTGDLVTDTPHSVWHPPALERAVGRLSNASSAKWVWWNLPAPPVRNQNLCDVLERDPKGVKWHSDE